MHFKPIVLAAYILMFFTGARVFAQDDAEVVTEQLIEAITENTDENFDYSELTERLSFYRKHPIQLNKTSARQLQELYFLSPVQISALLEHIRQNGPLIDLLELQSVNGFDMETIRRLLPFVKLSAQNSVSKLSLAALKQDGHHDLIIRYGQLIEKQRGYAAPDSSGRSHYLGAPQQYLARYRYQFGQNISASLNMEKDAGEQFFSGSQNGFDFYSGNVSVRNAGRISQLVFGDYALKFGQGLSLWSGLSFGKGADIASITKQTTGLLPYTSFNEAQFFRGIAASVHSGKFSYTPFVSYRKLDGALSNSDNAGAEISSASITGLHRTPTEAGNKNAIQQLVVGSALGFSHQALNVGATAYHTSFDHAFEAGKYLYNQYDFSGSKLTNVGLNYNYTLQNTYFFGEAAHSLRSGFAFINGLVSSISPSVSAVLLYRNYQKNYHSFYNQAIAESSYAVNEKGFYSGITVKPSAGWELSAYGDLFLFPWLRYRADAPSSGYEIFGQVSYTYRKKLKLTGRYKYEQKEENDEDENTVNVLETVHKQNYRLEVNYKLSASFSIRNRVEICRYQKYITPPEMGYLMYQDVLYNPVQSRFSGNLRFSVFDTPGYNSRIYAFENTVLYGYAVTAYQDNGTRYYLNGRCRLGKGIDVWCRYSNTSYTHRESVGSGLDEIAGNHRSDIRLQVRYQF